MPSFDVVNYSLRPNKSIQRQIAFHGMRTFQSRLDLGRMSYVGLGSIWFTDFVMAHKLLDIGQMVSIESDDIGYHRALFNKPYATVRVLHGRSSEVLHTLLEDRALNDLPWVVWLDYDGHFEEELKSDVRSVIERAPRNTILLVTFNGKDRRYGRAKNRPGELRELFGDVVPDKLSISECRDTQMQDTLAELATNFMKCVASEAARPGGFIPGFRMIYKDTSAMVTVGGILPSEEKVMKAKEVVDSEDWRCRPGKRIVAPLLTMREAGALQTQLPRDHELSRSCVQCLGFDLESEQIEAFQGYYREYPSFAQIVA